METVAIPVEYVVHAMLLRVVMDTLHFGAAPGPLRVIWTMRAGDDS